MAWIPAAIAAAGSIITQYMGNRANRKQSQFAYSKDLEMWNRQNEYNAPKAQMQRFGEAGLNPHLIYGQGNAGNASTLPQYNVPQQSYQFTPAMNPMSLLQNYLDLKQTDANINNTRERTRLSMAQNWLSQVQGSKLITETEAQAISNDLARDTYSANVDRAIATTVYERAKAVIQANHAQWSAKGLTPQDDIFIRQTFGVLEQMDIDNQAMRTLVSMLPPAYRAVNQYLNKGRTGLRPYNANFNRDIYRYRSNIPSWINKR